MVSHLPATHTQTHSIPSPQSWVSCHPARSSRSKVALNKTTWATTDLKSVQCNYMQQSSCWQGEITSPCRCWCVASWVLVGHRCWWAPRSASYRKRPPRWRPTLGEKHPGGSRTKIADGYGLLSTSSISSWESVAQFVKHLAKLCTIMRSGHGATIGIDDVAPGRSGDIVLFGAKAISSHRMP